MVELVVIDVVREGRNSVVYWLCFEDTKARSVVSLTQLSTQIIRCL